MKLFVNGIINMLRIIAGKYKGRLLKVPEDGTKPLTDRIKTSLFDLIRDFLTPNAIVLDLFSGSGNFGLEALSRGVSKSIMVDWGDEQASVIKSNIELVGSKKDTEVRQQDAFAYLRSEDRCFDIIMLDPPFPFEPSKKEDLVKLALPRLSNDGILIFRYPSHEFYKIEKFPGFNEVFQQKYGLSLVSFYRKI